MGRTQRRTSEAGVSHPRTPVEYLRQDEGQRTPRHVPGPGTRDHRTPRRGGAFTLCGHRLSSLYRSSETAAEGLMLRYRAPSSCLKYSTGVRGCETPAAVAAAAPAAAVRRRHTLTPTRALCAQGGPT